MESSLTTPGSRAADASPLAPIEPAPSAPMEQVTSAELADLRRRADRYRFLFKTIVTVTGILVGATLIVVLAALLTDL
jgi:hypothetical protein